MLLTEDWRNGGFGLYIHWPFCEAKCPYCDFNSHVSAAVDHAAWRAAYLRELERAAAETPGRILDSIFFGGGTPSLMEPETVAAIIETARRLWPTSNSFEVTLEANPGSVEAGRFLAFREGGINRISMGIQALNDADLKRLGRLHSVADARKAFDIARTTFDRVSFDLIYGRQDQTLDDWTAELKEALSMVVDHLSLYQLTIENGTAFGDRYARGKLRGLPTEDLGADMFTATRQICGEMGMPAYEVSNHAHDGAESRHNLIYWQYGDYVGIGPGAHGRVTIEGQKWATEQFSSPRRWLATEASGSPEKPRTALSRAEQAQEFLLMGLRLSEGVELHRYESLAGHKLNSDAIEHLQKIGMIRATKDRISVTEQGVTVLNSVLSELVSDY